PALLKPPQDYKEEERGEGQDDCLNHGHPHVAVRLAGEDLGRQNPEPASEDVGCREGGHRRHEDEYGGSSNRRSEHWKGDPKEDPKSPRSQGFRSLDRRCVETCDPCCCEEVEVDVHRVGVDEEDRPPTHKT